MDIDPGETDAVLRQYAEEHGFGWRFATASKPLLAALARAYGATILYPPAEPMLLVDAVGELFRAPSGYKSATAVQQLVEVARRAK